MKNLNLEQMENVQGGEYCTGTAAAVLLGFAALTITAATGGLGVFLIAAASNAVIYDSILDGNCHVL